MQPVGVTLDRRHQARWEHTALCCARVCVSMYGKRGNAWPCSP